MKATYYFIAAAMAGLAWFGGSTYVDLKAEQLAHARTKQGHTHALAVAEKQRADEESKRRKAEQELGYETERHGQEILALRAELVAVRNNGRGVAERLRNAASDAAKRAGEVCAASASSELRQAASDAILVLAELRSRADERAGELAQVATDAHLAGLACERRYEEARAKVMAY